jgi:uncharacterized protein YbaA (DUF1428 family)
MTYIDAFVLPVPKDKVEEYRRLCHESVPLWREMGALGYHEYEADDVPPGTLTSFPRAVMAKDDETLFLSIIIYPSREARDAAGQKMMNDPRMQAFMERVPTDGARMIFGGFNAVLVE